ncbi:MAG: DUF3098 domain-containing protein [Bacteroidaceae bacterium]|nr:DUF3098 domain-containing protein [Bacteroidaceae bacterium]
MNKNNFAFGRTNYILVGIGMAVIILGFLLMTGPGSTTEAFEPDIFSFRRVSLAPVVTLAGFVMMIIAIMYRPKQKKETEE